MAVSVPEDYIQVESGVTVNVTMITKGMSLIGPDYFDLGELTPGDYIVDFPDGSVRIINSETLNSEYMRKNVHVTWNSIDDARSFAMEAQYAIDHPEEHELTQMEMQAAKAHIRSAKNYLAERDESL